MLSRNNDVRGSTLKGGRVAVVGVLYGTRGGLDGILRGTDAHIFVDLLPEQHILAYPSEGLVGAGVQLLRWVAFGRGRDMALQMTKAIGMMTITRKEYFVSEMLGCA